MDDTFQGPPAGERRSGEEPKRPGPLRSWIRRAFWTALILFVILPLFAAAVARAFRQEFDRRHAAVVETILEGEGTDKLAVITLRGALIRGEGEDAFGRGGDPVDATIDLLDHARSDGHVKGILLVVDSPGGGITESDEIHHAVSRCREEGKKVLAFFGDVAASGGYYVACAADEIWAQPTTITGSIGVISVFPDLSRLVQTIGVGLEVVKSGPMKDMGSFTRPMTADERGAFQDLVDEMYERFLGIVWDSRKAVKFEAGENTIDYWRALADGRIYTAVQADENGLVDGVGYYEQALDRLHEMAGLETATVVGLSPPAAGILDHLFSARGPALPRLTAGSLAAAASPRILALWTGR